jgi:hypothetical protein
MIKKQLYPKTTRIPPTIYQITEKLDGANIGFFRCGDDLIIAQRNLIFTLKEILEIEQKDYIPGLKEFCINSGKDLYENLIEGSGFFAEFVTSGKYNFENLIHIFAKANIRQLITGEYDVYNIYYNRLLLIYPFKNQEIPKYISIVPSVLETDNISLTNLDKLYDTYSKEKDRFVEGFIIIYNKEFIQKYVRRKNGKLTNHFW